MIPWEHIDTAQIPGGGELKLMRRGAEYSIMSGAIELMNSRLSGSEIALADLALAKLGDLTAARILIGGLGMGFTLRAALAGLPKDAVVTVVELVPEVIEWAKGPLAHLFDGCLDDKRVVLKRADVGAVLHEAAAKMPYDAVLLDVDNGPGGLNRAANDRLYSVGGVAAIRKAIRHAGVLAVWSAGPDPAFKGRMHRNGFLVEERMVRAHTSGKGARHIIWVGVAR